MADFFFIIITILLNSGVSTIIWPFNRCDTIIWYKKFISPPLAKLLILFSESHVCIVKFYHLATYVVCDIDKKEKKINLTNLFSQMVRLLNTRTICEAFFFSHLYYLVAYMKFYQHIILSKNLLKSCLFVIINHLTKYSRIMISRFFISLTQIFKWYTKRCRKKLVPHVEVYLLRSMSSCERLPLCWSSGEEYRRRNAIRCGKVQY